MHISRVFIRDFRNFQTLAISLSQHVTCVSGENNSGKSNLLHALRLALDSTMGSATRQLIETDFHCDLDISKPQQIVIAVELTGATGSTQLSFSGISALPDLGPTIAFRFRPGLAILDQVDQVTKEYVGPPLTIEDYEPELVICQDNDPRTVAWHDPLGKSVRAAQLQEFTVEFLPALRDVEQDLRQKRSSPLEKLLRIAEVPQQERAAIESTFLEANDALQQIASVTSIAGGIHAEFKRLAGDVTGLDVGVGVADPTFAKLARNLTLMFEGTEIGTVDITRNGLGVNNLLYISMISEYFTRRIKSAKKPGQLFLIDEPEAHLHPQAQRVLYSALAQSGFQTIISTHSTHVASQAPIGEHVNLVKRATSTESANLASGLSQSDIDDVGRYLDATRSAMLFARHVILVEGPAELFIIPPLIKTVLGIDLDRLFISLVPIYGVHFRPYAALFSEQSLRKRCAILTDGDQSEELPILDDPDIEPAVEDRVIENKFVRVFKNQTTFERALALPGLVGAAIATFEELKHPRLVKRFAAAKDLNPEEFDQIGERGPLGKGLLSAALLHGKGRFAQVFSKHLAEATEIPAYIQNAVSWLQSP